MEDTTATTRKSKTAKTSPKAKAATAAPSAKAAASGKTTRSSTAKTQKAVMKGSITTEQRNRMIETAAYFIAESRGFCSNPVDDWLTAENQIDKQLGSSARL